MERLILNDKDNKETGAAADISPALSTDTIEENDKDNNTTPIPSTECKTEHTLNAGDYTTLDFVNAASGGQMGKQVYGDIL
jgi:hypothetical protein